MSHLSVDSQVVPLCFKGVDLVCLNCILMNNQSPLVLTLFCLFEMLCVEVGEILCNFCGRGQSGLNDGHSTNI